MGTEATVLAAICSGDWWQVLAEHLLAAAIFGAVGIVLFAIAMKVIVKVTPFSVAKEISEDQNVALAIVIGTIFLALAAILCAAIAGP